MTLLSLRQLDIRPMRAGDRSAVQQLIEIVRPDGAAGSTGLATTSIACHLAPTRIWVTQWRSEIVAAIYVTVDNSRSAKIHDLSILDAWCDTPLPIMMMLTALKDGKSRQCVRVCFDPPMAVLAELATLIDARDLDSLDHEPAQALPSTDNRLDRLRGTNSLIGASSTVFS